MREWTVADLHSTGTAALVGVIVVIFHLSVDAAVVVVAGRPVEGGVVVLAGLFYGGQGW